MRKAVESINKQKAVFVSATMKSKSIFLKRIHEFVARRSE